MARNLTDLLAEGENQNPYDEAVSLAAKLDREKVVTVEWYGSQYPEALLASQIIEAIDNLGYHREARLQVGFENGMGGIGPAAVDPAHDITGNSHSDYRDWGETPLSEIAWETVHRMHREPYSRDIRGVPNLPITEEWPAPLPNTHTPGESDDD